MSRLVCSPRRSSYSDAVEGQRKTPRCLGPPHALLPLSFSCHSTAGGGGGEEEWAYGRSRCLFCLLNCTSPACQPSCFTDLPHATHTHNLGSTYPWQRRWSSPQDCPHQHPPLANVTECLPTSCLLAPFLVWVLALGLCSASDGHVMCSARLEPDLRFPFF